MLHAALHLLFLFACWLLCLWSLGAWTFLLIMSVRERKLPDFGLDWQTGQACFYVWLLWPVLAVLMTGAPQE